MKKRTASGSKASAAKATKPAADAKATKASGTRVTVQACLDFHTVVLEDRKGRRGPAMDYATDRADLRLGKDGRWRVYETLQTQADSC